MTIAIGSDPTTLKSSDGYYDMPKVFSALIKSDENFTPIPDLAESWDIDKENKTITFQIRKDVKWHDGKPFTGHDVKYTFDAIRDENNSRVFSSGTSDLKIINSVEMTDPDTVVFSFNDMPVSTLTYLAIPIFPKHLLQNQDLDTTGYWLKPIGTGPYIFDHWNTRQELVFRVNKGYYGHIPEIDILRFVFIPEESTRIAMLTSGDVQATKISPKMERIINISGYKSYRQPSACWYGLSMPTQKWPFNITHVRRAIAYAANKQAMIDTLFNGMGEVAYGPYTSKDRVYNPEVAFYYDPGYAKQLLEEGGFEFRDSQWVQKTDGMVLEFDIYYVASAPERKKIAIILATDLNDIGIKANLVPMTSWADFDVNIARNQSNILSWGSPNDPDIPNYQLFSSKFIGDGWWNTFSYNNPEVDTLLEKGRYEWDPEKRREYYLAAQKIIANDQPVAFMVFVDSVYLIDDKINGIKPKKSPHASGSNGGMLNEIWWNFEEWTYRS